MMHPSTRCETRFKQARVTWLWSSPASSKRSGTSWARFGSASHGGIALGFDRMAMLMARAESLREVIAFPKTARGQDLMSEAPSPVDPKQLDELGIKLKG